MTSRARAKAAEGGNHGFWNYRVINHGDWVGIHEVYYNKTGKPEGYTLEAVGVSCNTEEGVEALDETLAQMKRALTEPVLGPDDFRSAQRKRAKRAG